MQFLDISEGQILYSPMWTTNTYLINSDGSLNHTWGSNFLPGVAVWWWGDGAILRTIRLSAGPGGGGGVQKVEWDGSVTWDFRYKNNTVVSHHDVKTLPNGNVLLIAWETITKDKAIAIGRNPDHATNGFSLDHIIEVEPTGPASGDIVWEWHVLDHLIQDFDPLKENYGVVADHPELVDINYGTSWDFMHTNSIDYNEEFDQILISVCYFNEVWVIDHSTTTQEAKSHSGGNSEKGGDILYRWGNPAAYKKGDLVDQKLFLQHDATWIDQGYPGEGNILVFNNGDEKRRYSSVDEITPPVNDSGFYYIDENSTYGPENLTWSYTASIPTDFYAGQFCGAQRLVNGDTLISNGESGRIFEVTPEKNIVWQYETETILFKAVYIPPEKLGANLDCSGSFHWTDVKLGATLKGDFQVKNIGSNDSILNWKITSYPSWGTWNFNPGDGENLTPEDGSIIVNVSITAPNEKNKEFEGYIKVENQNDSKDFDFIPVYLKTSKTRYVFHTFIDLFFLKLERLRLIKNN